MDIRDILKSFDSLSEAKTTTDKGVTTHKGDYGREFDTDEEGNAVVKKVKSTEPKPKGRRPDPDRPKLGKDDPKNKKVGDLFGRTTGAVPKGKKGTVISGKAQSHSDNKKDDGTGDEEPTSKKSLKEYFDQMDEALYEAALAVQPLPATPQQKQQQQMAGKPAFMIKSTEPGMPVITTQDTAVVKAAQTGGITIQKPGAATTAPGATPAAGAGSQVKPMEEDGENWIKGAIKHPGAFTKKASSHGMTPKEFANKVLAHKKDYPAKTEKQAQLAKTLGKMHHEGEMEEAVKAFSTSDYDRGLSMPNLTRPTDQVGRNKLAATVKQNRQANPGMRGAMSGQSKPQDGEGEARISSNSNVREAEMPTHYGDMGAGLGSGRSQQFEGGVAKQGFVILDPKLMAQIEPMDGTEVENDIVFSNNPNITAKLMAFAKANPHRLKISSSMSDTGGARPIGNQFSQASGPELVEGKKGVNPFAKKDTKKKPDENNNNIPDYAEDGKGPNDTKKKGAAPKKGVNPFAKKTEKKKVKEGKEQHLQAARLEGKSHALRKMPYNCTHDDMEEARCYHDGFKEGLDECYGQMPILGRTAVGEMGQGPEVDTMASYGADNLNEAGAASGYSPEMQARIKNATPQQLGQMANELAGSPSAYSSELKMLQQAQAELRGVVAEVGRGEYMKQQASKPGNTFKAFGQTMHDSDVLDEFAFEALDKQLNAILEGKEVTEGMTVSISKGQQGSPDSVSVSAQDGEADQLLSIIKSAGMGLFGGEEKGFNAPQGGTGAHGGISVVDDHDGMMALMRKLSGGGDMPSGGDYESEEGHEGHGEEDHMHGEEETCNECGGMMEAGHSCGSKEMVDEVESEDQMEFEVSENAPDSGADNTDADVAGNAAANSALATADAGADEEEGEVYSSPTNEAEDETGEEAGKEELDEGTCNKCDCKPCKCETMSESSFFNLFKKISMLSEESTEKKDEKAEKAGKKVANDIEYDEGHKGKDDNKAEKAGKKVTKDIEYDDKKDEKYKKDKKVDESYANSADDTFEADIDFMTKVISGGLNKQKSTGQTTIPVINGQKSRMGVDGLGSPMKESNDLLKDYRKLSGL